MLNFVKFKVNDYHVSINPSDMLLLADLESDILNDAINIDKIKPLNTPYSYATHHMYFEGSNQIECLAVYDLHYLDDIDEKDISFFSDINTSDGIIGFILHNEEILPIINPTKFSQKWLSE